jgi:lipoate---protein ligase
MKMIRLKGNNPYYNLACEEVLFAREEEDCLLIWQNANSIIIGKHQNTSKEVHLDKAGEYGCDIVRRITGGGTVYHDLGNINFSYIYSSDGTERKKDEFLIHLLDFLSIHGVKAAVSGKNDIVAGTRKISGCAQLQRGERVLFHGTLLYAADLSRMKEVLNGSKEKLESKGIDSIKSRVVNLSGLLLRPGTIDEFIDELECHIKRAYDAESIDLQPEREEDVRGLVKSKYETWDWNYGLDPECNYTNRKRFDTGEIEVCLNIEKHKIVTCKILGDYIGYKPVELLEQRLEGLIYDKELLRNALKEITISDYLGEVSLEDLITLFI